ncbi:MAG: tellurite resistance TerB family protein [Cyanothece sp. SIO1E1]|nr:tellurite resistance TerB family protein [Cyanothece sp. SIO1E1]
MALDKLFSNLVDSPSAKGALGGAASGAMVSLLMNKKARKKIGSGALKLGGAAALAGVGYFAYNKWKQGQPTGTPGAAATAAPVSQQPASTPAPVALQAPPPVNDSLAMKMVLAMVAAANADGNIDNQEMDVLLNAVDQAGLTSDENAQLTTALNQPPTLEEVAATAANQEEAAEIYGAAA